MKLMTGILAVGMMTGGVWAQNPNIITNVQNKMQGVQQQKINDSNAALGITGAAPSQAVAIKPSPTPSTAQPVKTKAAPVPPAANARVAPPKQRKVAAHPAIAAKPVIAAKKESPKISATAGIASAPAAEASKSVEAPEEKKWSMTGKRDPFFSPIVQGSTGSGCSTGKKCLEIGQIYVRGVVKSENGFIAVVTNSLNKAYFLRENDPVFNGYVVRITGDTVVFQETVQDKLGKPLTHEITKKIETPAV
jgi:Tfp pilus assembly protein PilP